MKFLILAVTAEEFQPCGDYHATRQSKEFRCFGMESCERIETKFTGGPGTNHRASEAVDKWYTNFM